MRRGAAAALLAALALAAAPARGRELLDMAGRRVQVPEAITRVAALSPPATYLVYAFDPALLVGVNFPLRPEELRFTAPSYRSLPVLGGMVGNGRNVNLEVLAAAHPDVILLWAGRFADSAVNEQFERLLAPLHVPVVYVRFDALDTYPAALDFMGELLGRRERARALRDYAREAMGRVAAGLRDLPASARPRVYYAEGADGLATDGEGSMHADLLPLAGGRNVQERASGSHMGMEAVSMEQVLAWDPDVILVKEPLARGHILADPRWRMLRAVREGRVLQIPGVPFNWFDRPPSFMRLLGLQWLGHALHPDRVPLDPVAETRRFYRLFLGVEITAAEAEELLCR